MDGRCPANSAFPTGTWVMTKEPEPVEPDHPLLLIPGICGTQLHAREKGSSGEGERVWVTMRDADNKYQRGMWGEFQRSSGKMECLLPGTEVVVPQGSDDSGLFPIGVLDPESAFAVRGVHYFDAFISYLEGQGYTTGKDLFGHGYDFRQSVRWHTAALLARLQEFSRRSGGRRVDVVTHSMGGLLVRALLAEAPQEFEALVHTWVAIGCPFGGAPGYAVDALITGVQFAGSLGQLFFVDRGTFRQACLQSPALFELLPPLDFPYQQPPPQLRMWLSTPMPSASGSTHQQQQQQQPVRARQQAPASTRPMQCMGSCATTVPGNSGSGGGGGAGRRTASNDSGLAWGAKEYVFEHGDLPGLLEQALQDNSVRIDDQEFLLPFNKALWEHAQQTQAAWRDAALPPKCQFFNLYGSGLLTPYSAQYGSWWRPIRDLGELPRADASFTYVDGDMTVPTESAVADGLEASGRVGIKVAHRDLVSSPEAWEQVLLWLGGKSGERSDAWVLVPRQPS